MASLFGRQLKGLRQAAGFTQEELASISGLSVNAISSLERGERRWPQFETVRALAAALDLPDAAREQLLLSSRRGGSRRSRGPASRVPQPPGALIGREGELKTLRDALGRTTTRLLTVTGAGGVGKTRLATEAALDVEREGVLDVFFAPLAPLGDPSLVAGAIGEALGMGDVPQRALPAAVAAAVDHRPTLLVLDNFEHLIDAAPLVAELLATAPELLVLATSRAPLRVRGEHELALSPLALPSPRRAVSLAHLKRSSAGRLLLERIRETRPDYRPGPRDAQALATICARLDALPLALELAAAWLRLLTPQEVLDRLESGAALPSFTYRDTPERHRTLGAAVGWSYELLEEEDRRLFRRLAVLPGGCTPASAAAMALEGARGAAAEQRALGALGRLVEQGLLVRDDATGSGRYRMLETVRAQAAERLAASGEGPGATEALVRLCLDLAADASSALFGPDQVAWLDRLGAEIDNLRTALSHLLLRGGHEEAARILGGTAFFWLIRSHLTEGLAWCERVLASPRALSDSVHARLLIAASMLAGPQQLTEQATAFLERALSLAESAGDAEALALGLLQHGFTSVASADLPGATTRFERSLQMYRERRMPWGEGLSLIGLGHVRILAGDLEAAERLIREAQAVLREAGSWWSHGITYSYLAQLALLGGRPDDCMRLALEAIARLERHQDRFDRVFCLVYLACACVDKKADLMAARLLGALDAVMNATGLGILDPMTRQMRDRYEGILRARCDPQRLERARAAGRETPLPRLRRDLERLVERKDGAPGTKAP